MKTHNKTQTPAVREGSFKTLRNVFYKNVPWGWLLANFLLSISMGYFYMELPDITAQIAAGEIFDSSLIVRFILLSVIQTICIVVASMSNQLVGYAIERNMRKSVWKKLIRITMKRYDEENPTTWISRMASDTTMATTFLTSIMEGIVCLIYLVVVFLSAYSISSSVALAFVATLPYFFLTALIPGKLKYRWAAARQEKLAEYTNFVAERLVNIRTVKACTMEKYDIQEGFQKATECYRAEKNLAIVQGVCEPFVYMSQIVLNLITIILGGKLLQSGEITNANLMTLYLQGSNFYSFALMTVSMYYMLRTSHGATKKIGELMGVEAEITDKEKPMPEKQGDIEFKDVSFAYLDELILNHVNFTIPRGKMTAIVGPSGSGKSTVLSLIQQLYVPNSGAVCMAGEDISKIHLGEWRKAVGTVQQNCPLLGGTVEENICYGVENRSEEAMIEAAKQAGIYEYIQTLPDGFQTDVGQLGDKMSGGQKQRIAIARTILNDPKILLLDEPTSNLDRENTESVLRALEQAGEGKTTVMVAHNLHSIRHADHIVVMNNGQVEAQGSREDVYAASPTFRRYCDLQKCDL